MGPQPIMERAFELARSGQFTVITELKEQLKKEGYSDAEEHMAGSFTKRQLSQAMRNATDRDAAQELSPSAEQ